MADLRPMLDRNRYTDEEWSYASQGRCDWDVNPGVEWCGQPSDPNSLYRYCTEHDRMARESSTRYGR